MSDAEYKSYLPESLKAIDGGMDACVLDTAIKITSQAKELAPRKTGQLAGSLMWKDSRGRDGLNTEGDKLKETPREGNYHVGTAVEHGIYQEFGTRHMEPNSFLRLGAEIVVNGTDKDIAMKNIQDDYFKRFLKEV